MIEPLKQQIQTLVNDALPICDGLERGQAETPLADHFRALSDTSISKPFSIVTLGLTPEARTALITWLYGKDFSVLSVTIIEQLGLIELSLSEKGYRLEHSDGQVQNFEQLQGFLEALQASDLFSTRSSDTWMDPVRLGVNTVKGLQAVKVYLPDSTEMVLKQPGLLNKVVSQSNLLVIAAPLRYVLTQVDQDAISEIGQAMDAVWPLLWVDELAEEVSIPDQGWWQKHQFDGIQLKPQLLTTHVDPEIPAILRDMSDQQRQTLITFQTIRRLMQAIEATSERCQQEIRQLESRKKREQRRERLAQDEIPQTERHQWDTIKHQINDDVQRLRKKYQDLSKAAMMPEAELATQLNQLCSRLTLDDLDQETGHKQVKLTVKSRFIEQLRAHLKTLLKKQLRQELNLLEHDVNQLASRTSKRFAELTDRNPQFSVDAPDEKHFWSHLKQQLTVTVRYRGDMPKRGFMKRLSDGRRAIMGISMLAMVIGGIFKTLWGVDFRSMIMLIAPLIFLGAVFYSYVIWPREDAERLERELDRIQDGFSNEIKRILMEVQRDKQSRYTDYLDQQKKRIQKQFDNQLRDYQAEADSGRTESRQQAQSRLNQIERQLREIQAHSRDCVSLERKANTLLKQGKSQLNQFNTL